MKQVSRVVLFVLGIVALGSYLLWYNVFDEEGIRRRGCEQEARQLTNLPFGETFELIGGITGDAKASSELHPQRWRYLSMEHAQWQSGEGLPMINQTEILITPETRLPEGVEDFTGKVIQATGKFIYDYPQCYFRADSIKVFEGAGLL